MRDDLGTWCQVRETVSWSAAPPIAAPILGRRDGIVDFADTVQRRRDPLRADRMLEALNQARADADTSAELTFPLMATWQRAVLGVPEAGFRSGAAFAKGGRERYGLTPGVPERFEARMREGGQPSLPLAARAARVYLDVAFFHPFADGNARAALLALYFVLAREQVVLDEIGPLPVVTRRADDAPGAFALAQLVGMLAAATAKRMPPAPH